MDERFQSIAAHIEAISTRTDAERTRLSRQLLSQAWPGGPVDRSEQTARGWVSRWRPRGPFPERIECACASGRCLVCN